MPLCWSAVYTRSCYEERVTSELDRLSIESFYPTFPEEKVWMNRQKVTIRRPLFPGYTLVRYDSDDHDTRIRILKIVGSVHILPGVTDLEVDTIQRLLAAGARPVEEMFVAGDLVKIRRGGLAGMEGIFERRRVGTGRFIVRIETLGRSVAAEVDARSVIRMHPSSLIGPASFMQSLACGAAVVV